MERVVFCTKGKAGSEHCPDSNDSIEFFSQFLLKQSCEIPCQKPSSKKLVKLFYSIEIPSTTEINALEHNQNKHCPGKNIIVTGVFHLGIEYLASECSTVNYINCDIPFNTIILPQLSSYQDSLFPPDFTLSDYEVYGCCENIDVQSISERLFESSITLMVWLKKR